NQNDESSATLPPAGAVCDDFGSARLVDEWLRARNALSIEIFLQDTPLGSSPRLLRLEACQLRHQGESGTPLLPCVTAALVDAGE
ncbi:MAG TPA: hypothetical protein VGB15_00190, partial [Longimicrobium sp.]